LPTFPRSLGRRQVRARSLRKCRTTPTGTPTIEPELVWRRHLQVAFSRASERTLGSVTAPFGIDKTTTSRLATKTDVSPVQTRKNGLRSCSLRMPTTALPYGWRWITRDNTSAKQAMTDRGDR